MSTMKILALVAASALGGLLPASAHHAETKPAGYLAFWKGASVPALAEADLAAGTCTEPGFWEKGFVSIYGLAASSNK